MTGEEDMDNLYKKCPAKVLMMFGKPKPQYAKLLAEEREAAQAAEEPVAAASET